MNGIQKGDKPMKENGKVIRDSITNQHNNRRNLEFVKSVLRAKAAQKKK